MPIHCDNCGAEIFGGQRFCRSCGRPTSQYSEEDAPTQAMPPAAAAGAQRSPVDTGQPARPYTNPVYSPPGYYQPPAVRAPVPTYTPPPGRSGWGWLVGIIGVVILSLLTMGVFVFSRFTRRPPRPPAPPARTEVRDLGAGGKEVITSEEITTTRSFPLSAAAKFAIQTTSGNITIEGWDKSQAEVITIARGGSEQDRRNLKLATLTEGGNLSLQSSSARGIEVEYIVKLPRKLAEISLEATTSDIHLGGVNGKVIVKNKSGDISLSTIKGSVTVTTASGSTELSEITGDVSVFSASGELDLTDIDGAIEAKSASGDMSVVFESVVPGKSLKFESASGDIELRLASTPDADLKAETVSGSFEIDEGFGMDAKFAGRGVAGRLGKGGLPLLIRTATGDIRITK